MRLIELVKRGNNTFSEVLDFLYNQYKDTSYHHEIALLAARLNDYHQNKRMHIEPDDNIYHIGLSICKLIESIENELGEIHIEEQGVVQRSFKSSYYHQNFFEGYHWLTVLFPISLTGVIIFFGMLYKSKTDNDNMPTINSIYQVGFDKSHKKLSLYIDILDKQCTWKKDSIIAAEYVYDKRTISLEQYFQHQSYLQKINEAQNIICLGNASYEEDLKTPAKFRKKQEEDRASIRAKHLQGIIKKLAHSTVFVHTANLGQYRIANSPSSNSQRAIIIIRVMQKEDDVNMNQALYDALNKTKELPFDIHQFSLARDEYLDIDTD
jgi:hypothetical protein